MAAVESVASPCSGREESEVKLFGRCDDDDIFITAKPYAESCYRKIVLYCIVGKNYAAFFLFNIHPPSALSPSPSVSLPFSSSRLDIISTWQGVPC